MYLFQLSCVSLGMGKNENLLAHYACDSTNIIQWHEDFFLLYIFGPPKAKLDLQEQISSGLAMGKKKAGKNETSDQRYKLVSVKTMID